MFIRKILVQVTMLPAGLCLTLLLTTHMLGQDEIPVSENIALLAHLDPQSDKASNHNYNDVWGYAADGREYALMGDFYGIWIIEVTNPSTPRLVQFVPGPPSIWRDIKTHNGHAYIVHESGSPSIPGIGLEIIDLRGLPHAVEYRGTFREGMPGGTAHNLHIENGLAYLAGLGANISLLVLNLQDPTQPQIWASISGVYFHDVIVNNGVIFGSALERGMQVIDAQNFN